MSSKLESALAILGGLFLCGVLVWLSFQSPLLGARPDSQHPLAPTAGPIQLNLVLVDALKLLFAALIGTVVSAVHRRHPGDKPIGRSLAQAQVLLCVAGALMMIIIGDSLARAFGIAGGAAIIRFRTPVEDPKDTTVLFLLLSLGMACGMGSFAVAGLGMAFLCVCLVLLEFVVERKPRAMLLDMVADGAEFPSDYVNRLLGAYRIPFEPREVGQGSKATRSYLCMVAPEIPLQRLSDQLLDAQAGGLKKVAWEIPKKT
jgi:hypothetical protein